MTCYPSLALLDDYIDGSLSEGVVEQLDEHLKNCSSCRREFAIAQSLKEHLRVMPAHQPPPEYWSELSSIIMARTVESPPEIDTYLSPSEQTKLNRTALIRSLVSLAASVVIMFSAILIGTSGREQFASAVDSETPLFVLAPLDQPVVSDDYMLVTRDERINMTRGMLLIGPPGGLSRITALTELNSLGE